MTPDVFGRVIGLDAWLSGAETWHAGDLTSRLRRQLRRSRTALCAASGLSPRPYEVL